MWTVTVREYEALRKVHESAATRIHSMYAALQATLHNAHFKHPQGDSVRFQVDDFMPGGRKPQSAEEKAAIFSAQMMAIKETIRARKRAESPPPEAIPAVVTLRAQKRGKVNAISGDGRRRGNPGDAIAGEPQRGE